MTKIVVDGSRSGLASFGANPLVCGMADYMNAVCDALPEVDGWSVDRHVSYDGEVTILAEHSGGDQAFTLSGPPDRIQLDRVYGDELVREGTFARIEWALNALRQAQEQS